MICHMVGTMVERAISADRASDVIDKWGEVVAKRGFTQVPNYLLFINQFLDEEKRFSPVELLVLLQISGAWWKKAELPFPSVRTLAARSGTSERQVLRALARLEKDDLLRRVRRRDNGLIASNAYDLSPLVALLSEVAKTYPNAFPRKVS